MRLWLKLVFIVLLAVRATTSAAQVSVLNTDNATPAAEQEKLNKPQHPACLTNEEESLHSSVATRWPLLIPNLPATAYYAGAARYAVETQLLPAANTPTLAFYRSLLFPAHFFR